jgi:uncharacterized membrane-anchored protein
MRTGQSRWDEPPAPARYAASKVPQITAYFWIIKLLSTAMGEATSDYMVKTINPVPAVLLGFAGFVVAMVIQFRAKAYNAWIYWLAVVMVAVFGTQAADVLHIKFHVPYVASTTFYAVVLAVIFVVWYRTERTLSIHSIRTPRREAFYWATVLATFALGTATGDMTAKTLNLGYLASGIWFSVAFAAVAVAYWKFHLNPILGFWVAYVLTRPVGASFADYVAFPPAVGGLGVGHGPVALLLTVVIAILVGYLAVTRKDVEVPPAAAVPPGAARHRRAMPPQPGSRPAPPRSAQPYPGQQYPREQYPEDRYPGQQSAGGRPPGQRYPGDQYPREQYPEDPYLGQQSPGERPPGQRYPGDQYPPEQYPQEQYPQERRPGAGYPEQRQYPDERYPGQPRPGAPGPPVPPRPVPPPPGPPPRSAPPPPPGDQWPSRGQPPRQDPLPRQDQPPSRRSWDDEDEAERTAEGFFAWDE